MPVRNGCTTLICHFAILNNFENFSAQNFHCSDRLAPASITLSPRPLSSHHEPKSLRLCLTRRGDLSAGSTTSAPAAPGPLLPRRALDPCAHAPMAPCPRRPQGRSSTWRNATRRRGVHSARRLSAPSLVAERIKMSERGVNWANSKFLCNN